MVVVVDAPLAARRWITIRRESMRSGRATPEIQPRYIAMRRQTEVADGGEQAFDLRASTTGGARCRGGSHSISSGWLRYHVQEAQG
jgi:hypothetical protein